MAVDFNHEFDQQGNLKCVSNVSLSANVMNTRIDELSVSEIIGEGSGYDELMNVSKFLRYTRFR